MKTEQHQVSMDTGSTAIKSFTYFKDGFGYTISCPVCDKRVLDMSAIPDAHVIIRLKCPHCRKVVKIPFAAA